MFYKLNPDAKNRLYKIKIAPRGYGTYKHLLDVQKKEIARLNGVIESQKRDIKTLSEALKMKADDFNREADLYRKMGKEDVYKNLRGGALVCDYIRERAEAIIESWEVRK